jgi:hypothetical protein
MNPEDLLRQAFEARAGRVEVAPDALGTIRRRIAGARPRRRALTIGLASLATTAAAVAATVALALPREVAMPPGAPTDGQTGGTPTQSVTPDGVATRVPVYYRAAKGNRLYREFHPVTLPVDGLEARVRTAVNLMLRGTAADPDYTGSWPRDGSVGSVRLDGAVAVVDLAGVSGNNVGAAAAEASVQQLVWTVTAVTADWDLNRPAGQRVNVTAVRLLVDGQRVSRLWGRVDVSSDLVRADALQTQAQLWLISPQEGDTVNREFTVHIDGKVPESNVILRVRTPTGEIVQSQAVTLGEGSPNRPEIHLRLTLEPGRYTIEAYYESLADGSVQALDDHVITVR